MSMSLDYPDNTYLYIMYRQNDTAPWKDVSPWTNPLKEEKKGAFEIDCYGFGTDLGENFSIKIQFIGYYYFYNWMAIDDIVVQGCGGCAEYAELKPGVTLQPDEVRTISFPPWTPTEWHNESYQDTWEKYPVQGFIVCPGDQRPRNDKQWVLLDLYYPWFYDIEISGIDEPKEAEEDRSIPGRVFNVQATMKNVGQFPLCCIGIDIEIGYPVTFAHPLSEYAWAYNWPNPPGVGWTDEHRQIYYYYGWHSTYQNRAGGEPREAYLYYGYARQGYKFYSPVFDTTDSDFLTFSFLTFIDHRSNPGLYAMEAGYSHDGGTTWNTAWHYEPSADVQMEVEVPIPGGSANTVVGFWMMGSQYYFWRWHVDNVDVIHKGIQQEYTDFMCQGDDLEAGEERVFKFDPWEPWDLADPPATTQSKEYFAIAEIDPEGDMDKGNNLVLNEFILDFWHDPALTGAGSPYLWNNGNPDGRAGLAGCKRYGLSNMLIDDFSNRFPWSITGGSFKMFWLYSNEVENMEEVGIWFFEDLEDCDPSEDDYVNFTAVDFTATKYGDQAVGRDVITIEWEIPEYVLPAGNWFVGMQGDPVLDYDYGYICSARHKGCDVHFEGETWNVPRWRSSSQQWGTQYDVSYKLLGSSLGPPGINQYMAPGTAAVLFEAINLGTFQELGLTATAEIKEFQSDPVNGTNVYTSVRTPVDLTVPLGGTVPLNFDPFTYAYEGRYGIYVDMPGLPLRDGNPENNYVTYGVGIDNTLPITTHTLDPATPDGDNGWYKSDLQVTLNAYDPETLLVSSGVDEMFYQIAGGPIENISGGYGSFVIGVEYDSSSVEVRYWAVDNVGNTEPPNSFTIKMDQTPAAVDLVYEVESGNPIQGWILVFNATASDITSGMDRVEFFLNDGIQTTEVGPGPYYEWRFRYFGDLSIDVRADAYDKAGNLASDIIIDPKPAEYENSQAQQQVVKILQQQG
jgi:hypothetical protein